MRGVLRPESEVVQVRELLAAGLSDYEIARRTGIPRGTILYWRHGRSQRMPRPGAVTDRCEDCGATHNLEALDTRPTRTYWANTWAMGACGVRSAPAPAISASRATLSTGASSPSARSAIEAVRPGGSRTFATSSGNAWSRSPRTGAHGRVCFPQHGPGRKHIRRIELAAWQQSDRGRAPTEPSPRADPFRRLPRREPRQDEAAKRARPLQVSALLLLQPLGGHPTDLFASTASMLGIEWRQWGPRITSRSLARESPSR